MKFIARWLFVILLAVPVMGAPGNDAAVAAPLLWMRDRSLTASANALLAEMRDAEKYGLRSRDYGADSSRSAPPHWHRMWAKTRW